jgi:DNA repair exonuclease SbcCD ATPase subunit
MQLKNLPEFVVCKQCGAGEDTKQQKVDLENAIEEKLSTIADFEEELEGLNDKLSEAKDNRNDYLANEAKNIRKKISDKQYLINQHINQQREVIYEQIEQQEQIINNYNSYEKLVLMINNEQQKKATYTGNLKAKELEVAEYLKNKTKIQKNKEISNQITEIEKSIKKINDDLFLYRSDLKSLENSVYHSKLKVEEMNNTILQLKADYEREKNLKLYLKVHGEDGISKHIILSILPQINSELVSLFSEMELDFELSIRFDDKKIEFIVERDGQEQPLHDYSGWEKTISCLTLHYINVKMSTLPLPNILTLDEVLARMNKVNFPKFVKVLQKLTEVFTTIDLITHSHSNELLEHIENEILITKVNNISKIV